MRLLENIFQELIIQHSYLQIRIYMNYLRRNKLYWTVWKSYKKLRPLQLLKQDMSVVWLLFSILSIVIVIIYFCTVMLFLSGFCIDPPIKSFPRTLCCIINIVIVCTLFLIRQPFVLLMVLELILMMFQCFFRCFWIAPKAPIKTGIAFLCHSLYLQDYVHSNFSSSLSSTVARYYSVYNPDFFPSCQWLLHLVCCVADAWQFVY